MRTCGIDGCKGGWVYLSADDDTFAYGVVHTLAELLQREEVPERVYIDIPIGLRSADGSPRLCDAQARAMLGPGASSVFPAPIGEILDKADYREAAAESRGLTGKAISKQCHAIIPKISEVDTLLRERSNLRGVVREVHPEVCFCGLNGGTPMSWKKRSEEGHVERMAVLLRLWPRALQGYKEARADLPRGSVANDDILDAMVNALTARLHHDALTTLPENPERDAFGLPMEMVYARPMAPHLGPDC